MKTKVIDWKVCANELYLEKLVSEGYKNLLTQSTGTDHIDLEEAKELGIKVYNLPDYSSNAVAEFHFKQLLEFSRREEYGFELQGKVLGIIGYGKIGRECGIIGKGFGMDIIPYDPILLETQSENDLFSLLLSSHIIFLCLPLNDKTRNYFSPVHFSYMKEKPVIVNCARRELLDEEMVSSFLKQGKISGYITDDHCSFKDERVLSTPHVAWKTKEAFERRLEQTDKKVKELMED